MNVNIDKSIENLEKEIESIRSEMERLGVDMQRKIGMLMLLRDLKKEGVELQKKDATPQEKV